MKLKKKNKKGVIGHPVAIVYIIFCLILAIFSIAIAYNLATNIDVNLKFSTFNLRYNNVITRLLYSPNCFAREQTYMSELGQRTSVVPGVLDYGKIDGKNYKDCLYKKGGENFNKKDEYNFAISLMKAKKKDATSGDSSGATKNSKAPPVYEEEYIVGSKKTCTSSKWDRLNEYIISVYYPESGTTEKGVMRFCMKR